MADIELIDMLFQSVLARFFSIPARKPFSGSITIAQMRVLWLLEMKKSATSSEVARLLGISNSTATELIDRLVLQKYIQRLQSKKDRRQVVLTLTQKALRLMASHTERRRERFQRLFLSLDNSDIQRMSSALQTLSDIIGKWEKTKENRQKTRIKTEILR